MTIYRAGKRASEDQEIQWQTCGVGSSPTIVTNNISGVRIMSYYYNYCVGYLSDKKIYPLGPYTKNHKLKYVLSRSRSFASDLYEEFCCIKDDAISDELRAEFEYKNWKGENEIAVKYLPVSDLPVGSFVKKGYFLVDDVKKYEFDESCVSDLFFEYLTPSVYAAMVTNEMAFGKPDVKYDVEGEQLPSYTANDYMYYAYPDYHSREYEAFLLRVIADCLSGYRELPEDAVLVILETEG